jgi:hypothetical protein
MDYESVEGFSQNRSEKRRIKMGEIEKEQNGRREFIKKLFAGGVIAALAAVGFSKFTPQVHAPAGDAPSTGWHQGSGSMVGVGQTVFVDSSGPTYMVRDGYIGNLTQETTAAQIFTDAITNA